MDSAWSWLEFLAPLLPLLVMIGWSVLLLTVLLIIIAFLLLFDRKVWRQCSYGADPMWLAHSGCCSRSPTS
jgi:NADH:ubiquinone oxidoreductase subunit H